MEKLKLHTPDLTAQNVEKLAQLFPNCVTETRDTEGSSSPARLISIGFVRSFRAASWRGRRSATS